MSARSLLLTSFDTWMSHQVSNSSDDLLLLLEANGLLHPKCTVLHRLPVAVKPAFAQILRAIEPALPDIIVLCGMAEDRNKLSLEQQAVAPKLHNHSLDQSSPSVEQNAIKTSLQTALNLQQLQQELTMTEVSCNAGNFVCNDLYYELLKHLKHSEKSEAVPERKEIMGLFIHVPCFTDANRAAIVADFCLVLDRLINSSV